MFNVDVRQETIHQTICVKGYARSVRPPTSYTASVKKRLLLEAGLSMADAERYELDHRIPLALGGHPRNLQNLTLQPWDGDDGAKKKDVLERRLHLLVCTGALSLSAAQLGSYVDWQKAYRRYVDGDAARKDE